MDISLLLVAADPEALLPYLQDASWNIVSVRSIEEALVHLKEETFQVVVTTLDLPDIQGLKVVQTLQGGEHALPLIALTEAPSESFVLEALHLGAQECLGSEALVELKLFVRHALERFHTVEALRALSFTDELTGLYNRRGFSTLVKQQMDLARRLKRGFCLFFIDLDDLKGINDTYGHPAGDQALQAAASCLRTSFRASDIVARLGGDEFAVLALNVPKEKGKLLRKNLQEAVCQCQKAHPFPFTVSVSIGMSYYDPAEDPSIEVLLKRADQDLYRSKLSK